MSQCILTNVWNRWKIVVLSTCDMARCAVMKFKCYFVKKIKKSGKQEIITPQIAFREQNRESM